MNRLPNALVGDENTRRPTVSSLRLSRHERRSHIRPANCPISRAKPKSFCVMLSTTALSGSVSQVRKSVPQR